MKESKLALLLRILVYAAAFVPLIIFNEFISPFHFGKVVIFRSIVEVMAVIYILLIWKDRSYLPKMTSVGRAFLFFALAFSITTATSVIPYSSFWGSLERMGGLFTFWHYFVYFIILISVFRTESQWLNLFKVVIGVGVLSAFYGFLQRTEIEWVVGSGNRSRIFGTIGNPALFAGYQIVCAFLALTLFFRSSDSNNIKIFYGSSALIMTIAALMTAVRGSVLGIGVGFLAFALLYTAAYRSNKAKKVLLGLIAGLFMFVIFALLFKDSSFVKSSGYLTRITDFSLQNHTIQTRFWAWEAGLKGWKEKPKTILFGWGPENFNIPFSRYFNPLFYRGPGSETLFDRAHNMFVEILVTMGLAGFLTYLWIFGASLRSLWRMIYRKDTMLYSVGFISLLIAYAIHNSFIFDTSANFLVFFTILGFISFLLSGSIQNKVQAGQSRPADVKQNKKFNNGLWSFFAVILIIFVAIFIYWINVLPSRANFATTRAIVAGWDGNFANSVIKYKEALTYDTPGKYDYRHRFIQDVINFTNSKTLTPELVDVLTFAAGEAQKNIDENPVDYLPYLYMSRVYITLGKGDPSSEYNDKALEASLKAIDLSRTFVRAYYEVGQAYLNKKDFVRAGEYFKRASELNPDVGLSLWYWAIVEMELGNTGHALELIDKVLQSRYVLSESEYNKLISIYLEKNDFAKLAWVYGKLTELKPENPQYRASLAVAYARIGKIDEAVIEAKKAAELNSEFEAEARMFIQQLGRQW